MEYKAIGFRRHVNETEDKTLDEMTEKIVEMIEPNNIIYEIQVKEKFLDAISIGGKKTKNLLAAFFIHLNPE